MMRGDPMGTARRTGLSPNPAMLGAGPMGPPVGGPHPPVGGTRDAYFSELHTTNSDLQRDLANLKKELELTNQKLGSSMHSIKTFWSPELKKERALRKEESAKYSLINDQLKLLNSENQKQAMLVRQLEEEVVKTRAHAKETNPEIKAHIEGLQMENDHLTREVAILKETTKELEMRIDTQKQTLQARDESIKKLLEMMQSKGEGKEEEARVHQHMHVVAQRQLEDMRVEVQRKEQDLVQMQAKMKTAEEQHADYQRHIAVLKESLIAKEEHYNMLQIDVDELRGKLEEKDKLIEKKTNAALHATQDKNRIGNELGDLRDQVDIKDRKINVLQRKIENLEELLKEKDNQVDIARSKLSAVQAQTFSSEGTVTSLEEALGDRDKQIVQLREQRDRAEKDLKE